MTPLRISLTYALIGALWIIFSDRIVDGSGFDQQTIALLQTAKGWFFILVTASLLYLFVRHAVKSVERYHTDREKAKDLLRKSEDKYRILLESANSIILRRDAGGRVTFINEFAQKFFGYREDEILGKNIIGTLIPETESTGRDLRRMVEDIADHPDRYVNNINENMRRNGERVWIAWTNKPVYDENGKTIEILAIGNDITERRRAGEELDVARKRLARAEIISRSGNWEFDLKSQRVYASEGARKIYGLGDAEWTIPEVQKIPLPEYRAMLDEALRGLIEDNRPYNVEFRIQRPDTCQKVDIHCVAEYDRDRNVAFGIIQDITERKQTEEERKGLQERLQRAEKMEALGMLAGGVAHDLNNVLGILVGYSELLLSDMPADSGLRGHVEKILNGGGRAAAIVQDLLTLARRGLHSESIVNLNALIADIQKTPEFENLRSSHPQVRFRTDPAPDLLNIKGSPSHLHKTVMNLLTNAVEAMPGGGVVTVSTGNRNLDHPVRGYDDVRTGDYAVLAVSDTGEGIAGADLKHIFEPFYTKKVMGRSGTGLGLAVVWGTVKDHQGYIDVQSEPGKGSTFTLYFPLTREAEAAAPVAVPLSEYSGRGESILVVDDIPEQRELAANMLGRLNYRVATAVSGEEAVEVLQGHPVDLLVLDMIMDPGMDGLDTYRKILAIHPGQKAIIVSGFSETDRVLQAQALGAGDYVRKPYILEKLGLAVRKELDRT